MEIAKAVISENEEARFLSITLDGKTAQIPITADNPNDVKAAFNILIAWVKRAAFQIELEEAGSDLYSQVAIEYISQLNGEINEVRSEMEAAGMVEQSE